MTVTYDDTLSTDLSTVRFEIGDTVSGAGKRPNGANFTDAEIAAVLTLESDRVNAAVAHCFEALGAEWTAFALAERNETGQFDAKGLADSYFALAKTWRAKSGGSSEAERISGLVTLQRVDPYTLSTEYSN